MCLDVTHVPANRCTKLICKGFKELLKEDWGFQLRFSTPILKTVIPRNGWLFPHRQTEIKQFHREKLVHGGVIHFYDKMSPNYHWFCSSVLDCYAFGVEAFESHDWGWASKSEAVARCLYIRLPHHDGSTEQKILSLMDGQIARRGVTAEKMIKLLPELKPIKRYLV